MRSHKCARENLNRTPVELARWHNASSTVDEGSAPSRRHADLLSLLGKL
jgi:hypothetical protein